MRELGSGTTYNTHNTTSLIRTLKYVSDILQTEEAFTVEEYKHTHTHTDAVNKYIYYLGSLIKNVAAVCRLGKSHSATVRLNEPFQKKSTPATGAGG